MVGASAARASGVTVPTVDRPVGMPTRSATRATARSPSWWNRRVKPVGAKASGSEAGRPKIVVDVSMAETSRRMVGMSSTRAKASRARRKPISVSAAPSA